MKKIKSLSTVSTIGVVATLVPSLATACSYSNNQVEHTSVYWKTPKIANTIYCINGADLSTAMRITLESLQGILAQTEARIFIYSGDQDRDNWLYDMQAIYGFITKDISDPWQLINMYRNEFGSKYIYYTAQTENNHDNSVNYAATLAGVQKHILIEKSLVTKAQSYGYKQAEDATSYSIINLIGQYGHILTPTMLINQKPTEIGLRDYAIASKSMCSYLEYEDESEKELVTQWLRSNAAVLGWNDDELNFVKWLSEQNLVALASNHCVNLSLYSVYNPKCVYKQKRRSKKIIPDKNKHYVALVMSDGDNLQWMQGSFKSSDWFGSKYRGQFPMSWTISPSTYDLNATALDYYYEKMSDNDYFITSPSGYAYRNLGDCKNNNYFTETSLKYMHDTDQHVINFLDWYTCTKPEEFTGFMQSDQVKGAVWSENQLYLSGGGEVYWINDKPIISMRDGLWDRSEGDLRVAETAKRVNAYPCDPYKIDGYTVLICGCWVEGKMDKVKEFVDLLDDHVELVTADQLIDMVIENVPHEYAKPEHHSPIG